MLVSEALAKINYALRGVDDSAPTFGNEEAAYWLSVLNQKKNELYEDTDVLWGNTYEARSIGTISAATAPSFDLDDDFLAASNDPYALDANAKRSDLVLIKPQEQTDTARQSAFIAGQDPEVLYLTNEVTATDPLVGSTLYLPAFFMPDDLTTASDTLPFLNPYWAVMATAAEIAFNDIVYETKSPDLLAKANDLYKKMVTRNNRGTHDSPRKVRYQMKRIRAPDRR